MNEKNQQHILNPYKVTWAENCKFSHGSSVLQAILYEPRHVKICFLYMRKITDADQSRGNRAAEQRLYFTAQR